MSQQIPLTKGQFTLVDDADFEWLTQWRWRLNSKGYVIRSYRNNGKEIVVAMHRAIMQPSPNFVVDHIDHNRINNTRPNLRLLTQQQNLMNRRLFRNNTTGFKGVTYRDGRWRAHLEKDGIDLHLGYHADIKTAALVYDHAAVLLFGADIVWRNLPLETIPSEIDALVRVYLRKAQFLP
ncbi:MAG: HNH endonuclease [Chloroflexi bacterium]|nr:HNH endonuclease [Chloroflexota bacterium]